MSLRRWLCTGAVFLAGCSQNFYRPSLDDFPTEKPPCKFEIETLTREPVRALVGASDREVFAIGPDPSDANLERVVAFDERDGGVRDVVRRQPRITSLYGERYGALELTTDTDHRAVDLRTGETKIIFGGRSSPTGYVECADVFGFYWFEPRQSAPTLWFGFPEFAPERLDVTLPSAPVQWLTAERASDGCTLFALTGASAPFRLERLSLRAPRTPDATTLGTWRDDVTDVAFCSNYDQCVAVADRGGVSRYAALGDSAPTAHLDVDGVRALGATKSEVVFAQRGDDALYVSKWDGARAKLCDVVAPKRMLLRGSCAYFMDAQSGADPNHVVVRRVRFR